MSTARRLLRIPARVLLTLFILGQFVFLLSSNFLGVEEPLREWFKNWYWKDDRHKDVPVPDYLRGEGKIHDTYFEATRTWTKRWSQLTGQPQNWGLFAPSITEEGGFPAVELRWDDQDWPDWTSRPTLPSAAPAPVVVLSDNEPRDRRYFARISGFRIRKYEENITPYPSAPDGGFDPATNSWRSKVRDKLKKEPECMYNYLRWRLRVYQQANPNLPPPTQVILLMRLYKVPKPPGPEPWDWFYLGEQRVARWLPSAPLDPNQYELVECYDPVTDGFERVEK